MHPKQYVYVVVGRDWHPVMFVFFMTREEAERQVGPGEHVLCYGLAMANKEKS